MEDSKEIAEGKKELKEMGFPCYMGNSLTYFQIANILRNEGFIRLPPNKEVAMGSKYVNGAWFCSTCNRKWVNKVSAESCCH